MADDNLKKQSIHGEIEYRKKLVKQRILSEGHYFDNHDSSLDEFHDSWMKPQMEKLGELMKEAYPMKKPSFFLEIGSESSHLGLNLRNKYGLDGVCVDLSADTLKLGTSKVAERLGIKKKPFLVVADVHQLPFRGESFDLILCFGALHHFYDLEAAVKEVRRVCIETGVFLASHDPLKPFLKPKPKETYSEISYGILENTYTIFGYTSPMKKFFSKVRVIYPESSERIDLYDLHRIRRLRGNRILAVFQSVIPKKIALILRLLWVGLDDDFSIISIA